MLRVRIQSPSKSKVSNPSAPVQSARDTNRTGNSQSATRSLVSESSSRRVYLDNSPADIEIDHYADASEVEQNHEEEQWDNPQYNDNAADESVYGGSDSHAADDPFAQHFIADAADYDHHSPAAGHDDQYYSPEPAPDQPQTRRTAQYPAERRAVSAPAPSHAYLSQSQPAMYVDDLNSDYTSHSVESQQRFYGNPSGNIAQSAGRMRSTDSSAPQGWTARGAPANQYSSQQQSYIQQSSGQSASQGVPPFRATHGNVTYALAPVATNQPPNRPQQRSSKPSSAASTPRGPPNSGYPSSTASSYNPPPSQSLPLQRPSSSVPRPSRPSAPNPPPQPPKPSNPSSSTPTPPIVPSSSPDVDTERALKDRILELERELIHQTLGLPPPSAQQKPAAADSESLITAGASALHALESELESNYLELARLQDELIKSRSQYSQLHAQFSNCQNQLKLRESGAMELENQLRNTEKQLQSREKELLEGKNKWETDRKRVDKVLESVKSERDQLKGELKAQAARWKSQKAELETRFALLVEETKNQSNDRVQNMQERMSAEEARYHQITMERNERHREELERMKDAAHQEMRAAMENAKREGEKELESAREEWHREKEGLQRELERMKAEWEESQREIKEREGFWTREQMKWRAEREELDRAAERSKAESEWRRDQEFKQMQNDLSVALNARAAAERAQMAAEQRAAEQNALYEEIVKARQSMEKEQEKLRDDMRKQYEQQLTDREKRLEHDWNNEKRGWEGKLVSMQKELEGYQRVENEKIKFLTEKHEKEMGEIKEFYESREKEKENHVNRLGLLIADQRTEYGKEIGALRNQAREAKEKLSAAEGEKEQIKKEAEREKGEWESSKRELERRISELQRELSGKTVDWEKESDEMKRFYECEMMVAARKIEEWQNEMEILREQNRKIGANNQDAGDASAFSALDRAYAEVAELRRLREEEREQRLRLAVEYDRKLAAFNEPYRMEQELQSMQRDYHAEIQSRERLEQDYQQLAAAMQEKDRECQELAICKATLNALKRQMEVQFNNAPAIEEMREKLRMAESKLAESIGQREAERKQWMAKLEAAERRAGDLEIEMSGQRQREDALRRKVDDLDSCNLALEKEKQKELQRFEVRFEEFKDLFRREKAKYQSEREKWRVIEEEKSRVDSLWRQKVEKQREEIVRLKEEEALWRVQEEKWRKQWKIVEENERREREKERDRMRLRAVEIANAKRMEREKEKEKESKNENSAANGRQTKKTANSKIIAPPAPVHTALRAALAKSNAPSNVVAGQKTEKRKTPSSARLNRTLDEFEREFGLSGMSAIEHQSPVAPLGTMDPESFNALQRLQHQMAALSQMSLNGAANTPAHSNAARDQFSSPHDVAILTNSATPGAINNRI